MLSTAETLVGTVFHISHIAATHFLLVQISDNHILLPCVEQCSIILCNSHLLTEKSLFLKCLQCPSWMSGALTLHTEDRVLVDAPSYFKSIPHQIMWHFGLQLFIRHELNLKLKPSKWQRNTKDAVHEHSACCYNRFYSDFFQTVWVPGSVNVTYLT